MKNTTNTPTLLAILLVLTLGFQGCDQRQKQEADKKIENEVPAETDKPEYFLLRPEVEKAYGYSHAVKIGSSIIISGAVSMDDKGNPTAIGDIEQQMTNCYYSPLVM